MRAALAVLLLGCCVFGVGCGSSGSAKRKTSPKLHTRLFAIPSSTCGEGGIFVQRLIGLPGDTVHEDAHGFIDVDGKRLTEPYVRAPRRLQDTRNFDKTWHVPRGRYFVLGDNRPASCDSRVWGSVPARNVIGTVVKVIRSGSAT